MIAWALDTPRDLMLEQLTGFAKEVLPAFTSTPQRDAAVDADPLTGHVCVKIHQLVSPLAS